MRNVAPCNIIQHGATWWPNEKMLCHPTMLDDVARRNISRLVKPLVLLSKDNSSSSNNQTITITLIHTQMFLHFTMYSTYHY